MSDPTRRGLLCGLALGCACGLTGCALPGPGDTADTGFDGLIDAGMAGDYPLGTLDTLVGTGVAVGHDIDGLYAISTICTHRSCDMATRGHVDAGGLECACHGSEFAADGSVIRGPATRPLPFYAVLVDGTGAVTVDLTQVVDPDARTPINLS